METQKVRHQSVVVGEDAELHHQEVAGAVHFVPKATDT